MSFACKLLGQHGLFGCISILRTKYAAMVNAASLSSQATQITHGLIAGYRGGVAAIGVRKLDADLKPLAARDNRLAVKKAAPAKLTKVRPHSVIAAFT